MEELSAGSNDLSMILRGKRTKRRQRPLSPVSDQPAVVPGSTSSSSSGGGRAGEDGDVLGYFYPLNPSSTTTNTSSTSDDQQQDDDDDEDDQDQDIANCLILLAQGDGHQRSRKKDSLSCVDEIKVEKLSSRRFTEMVISTTGSKVGFFVYECKTCNRTFPSFQALGGHRASHKKPKVVVTEEKLKAAINEHHQEEEEDHHHHHHQEIVVIKEEVTQPIQDSSTSKCKAKNHECSICGAEFSSGQALGGHMRRHRNPPPAMASSTTKVSMVVHQTSPVIGTVQEDVDEKSHVVKKKQRIDNKNVFQLDLNLPAPVEDDHHHHHHIHKDLKFQQQQQQHHLVFSATPALVDCHY
ncbi:OLC1v1003762C1 [Oldenlandia corymbosa var. corymbosa]|uniref:OLC1v1003762C1 n=1 Tax=Oldenlandia corymbosa var. corymbosa TaxID=529605 RepID=A0AAV1DAX4_OLDCO|nr:OLC1v1003762C1 [Oldenlandia corymbosa var. corymbosa]